MHSDELAFIAAIKAAPDDDAPRLIFADWLDEHGQSERAEFIRVQIELTKPQYKRSNGEWYVHPNGHTNFDANMRPYLDKKMLCRRDDCPSCPLRKRECDLLQGHDYWDTLPFPSYGLLDTEWNGRNARRFRRGFVDSIACPAADWHAHGDAILQRHPVREVRLTTALGIDPTWPPQLVTRERASVIGSASWSVAEYEVVDALLKRRWPGVAFNMPQTSGGFPVPPEIAENLERVFRHERGQMLVLPSRHFILPRI